MREWIRDNNVVAAVLLVVVLIVLWQIRVVIALLLIAFLLTVALRPLAKLLRRVKIPEFFAIIILFVLLVGIGAGLFLYLKPIFATQGPGLAATLNVALREMPFAAELGLTQVAVENVISQQFASHTNDIFSAGMTIAQLLIMAATVIVMAVYWLVSYESIRNTIVALFPADLRSKATEVYDRIEFRLSKWCIGQLLLSLSVGVAVWLGATALGLRYAIILALITFLLEVIPTVGPVVSAIPAVMIGLLDSPEKAVAVIVLYVVIQQLENHILAPLIMGTTVNLHPLLLIVAFLIGGVLFGITGAFLAVPAALIVGAVFDSFAGTSATKGVRVSRRTAV